MIPYSTQTINKEDIKEVIKTLQSQFLTQGPKVEKFEKIIAKKVGSKFASVVNSATSALHISCMALGFKKNDILWTSPNTFVASANCALHLGGKVDFVDIDYLTGNIDINLLEKKLILAKKKKKSLNYLKNIILRLLKMLLIQSVQNTKIKKLEIVNGLILQFLVFIQLK